MSDKMLSLKGWSLCKARLGISGVIHRVPELTSWPGEQKERGTMMCLGSSPAPDSPKALIKRLWRSIPAAVGAGPGWQCLASVTSPCRRRVGGVGSWLGFFENGVTGSGSGREGEAALSEPSRGWSWGILHPLLPVHRHSPDTGRSQGSTSPRALQSYGLFR